MCAHSLVQGFKRKTEAKIVEVWIGSWGDVGNGGAYFSWLEGDGNFLGVGAFVEDRERQALVSFVEFVSAQHLREDLPSFPCLSRDASLPTRTLGLSSWTSLRLSRGRAGICEREGRVEREKRAYKAVNWPHKSLFEHIRYSIWIQSPYCHAPSQHVRVTRNRG